jgi:uncharacterized membrane protein
MDIPKPKLTLDRLTTLVDGVLAIVLTLMVLNIDIPADHSFDEDGLLGFLHKIGFQFFLYAISFAIVATYWLEHAAILHYVRLGDRNFYLLNLLFLLPVTLLPFVTDLKGTYRFDFAASALFGALQIACGVALLLIWWYAASHPELLVRPIPHRVNVSMIRRLLISPIAISFAAILVSKIELHVGTALFLSMPFFFLSHREVDSRWSEDDSPNMPPG